MALTVDGQTQRNSYLHVEKRPESWWAIVKKVVKVVAVAILMVVTFLQMQRLRKAEEKGAINVSGMELAVIKIAHIVILSVSSVYLILTGEQIKIDRDLACEERRLTEAQRGLAEARSVHTLAQAARARAEVRLGLARSVEQRAPTKVFRRTVPGKELRQ